MNTSNIGPSGGGKSNRRSQRPSPEISPHARKPTRKPGRFEARVNIDIPHDPGAAARVIRSTLGDDFARALIDELTSMIQPN